MCQPILTISKAPVQCVFQSAKTFENGGPYKDLIDATPRDAKRDQRLKNSGKLVCFSFEGKEFPLEPKTAFYDYIYLNALLENDSLVQTILRYVAFTDIEFNPEKSLNCHAKAAATFVALSRLGLIERVKNFEAFLKLKKCSPMVNVSRLQTEKAKMPIITDVDKKAADKMDLTNKKWIIHKLYGRGHILSVDEKYLFVEFPEVGQKKLGTQWCMKNCGIE